MPVHRYDQFTWQATKALPCPDCGKRLRRQRTFSETQNPFNRNAQGVPKTLKEIFASLQAKAAVWQTEPETCKDCQ
jgi:hypothetical protein